MKKIKINGHGHILPEPKEIPQFMKDKKLFWIDDDKKFMRQGTWSRPITDSSFFFKEKLEWMDKQFYFLWKLFLSFFSEPNYIFYK